MYSCSISFTCTVMTTLLYLCALILSLVGWQDLGTNLKLGDLLATLTQPVLERLERYTRG